MSELRPIGTRFKMSYPPSFNSTDVQGIEITFEVIGHRIAMQYEGDKVGRLCEELIIIGRRPKLGHWVYNEKVFWEWDWEGEK